jgi:hypothetical protein
LYNSYKSRCYRKLNQRRKKEYDVKLETLSTTNTTNPYDAIIYNIDIVVKILGKSSKARASDWLYVI